MLNRDHCRMDYSKLMRELKTIEKDYLPMLPSKLAKQYTELQETQQKFKDDAVFNAAARMVRLLHDKHLNLIKALKAENSENKFPVEKIFKSTPLMISSKVAGKVYVFPNLIVDTVDRISLRNTCWVICFDTLESLNKIRISRPTSWKPFFRAWRKIKKYEEISIMRALTRYTNICKVLTHTQIQAVEEAYLESIAPLKLIYADKPEDYLTMFEGGVSSCMTTTKDKEVSWRALIKHKHHPMSLFAYHPYIKGVYAIKDKKVVARTLLYQASSGAWQYGRIFAINKIYMNRFENVLLEVGHTILNQSFSRKIEIVVPGIYSKSNDDYLLPVPYMDNIKHSVHVEFDREKKEFSVSFGYTDKTRNISCGSTGGYIKAVGLEIIKCSECGQKCNEKHHSWDGQRTFCSLGCTSAAGYVYARTSHGDMQLRRSSLCYVDYLDSSQVFTGINSCKRNNGKRVIHSVSIDCNKITAIQTHPEEFSTCGLFVVCNGETYAISNYHYTYLEKEDVITSDYRLICGKKGAIEGVSA